MRRLSTETYSTFLLGGWEALVKAVPGLHQSFTGWEGRHDDFEQVGCPECDGARTAEVRGLAVRCRVCDGRPLYALKESTSGPNKGVDL